MTRLASMFHLTDRIGKIDAAFVNRLADNRTRQAEFREIEQILQSHLRRPMPEHQSSGHRS